MGVCGDFDDVGMLASITSMLALTDDSVTWSGLEEVRGWGFGGDPCGRWMLLRNLIIGPGEAPVLNYLPLLDLLEVLLQRRRVESSGKYDNQLRGDEEMRALVINV